MDRTQSKHPWDSPAYEELMRHNKLRDDWRKQSYDELDIREGNSTPCINSALCCICLGGFGLFKTAEVPAGSVRMMEDGRGGYDFLGNRGDKQGIHLYLNCFYSIHGMVNIATTGTGGMTVHNGDKWIVIVPQGFVGLAEDMGQPVLLPPGMHQWQSATMRFDKNVDLTQPVIHLGPYTLLTVDEGYEAVTQNNGSQEVLEGGRVHLLQHRNHKFEKFITTKIQTDDLRRIQVMTGDNVLMQIDGTVCWRVKDVKLCAVNAAETMHHSINYSAQDSPSNTQQQDDRTTHTIAKLREDVLKQADASLSTLVGKVNFSDTFSPMHHAVEGIRENVVEATAVSEPEAEKSGAKPEPKKDDSKVESTSILFNKEKLQAARDHANSSTIEYGVEILSINIISAKPTNDDLMQSLAKGAVAAAEAQQLEKVAGGKKMEAKIVAEGEAQALRIMAEGEKDAEITRAEGAAKAEVLRAEGAADAAQKIETAGTKDLAVELAKITATGEALHKSGSTLILGDNPSAIGSMLLANPNILKNSSP